MDADLARDLEALEGILTDPSKESIKISYGVLKFITNKFYNEIGRGGFGIVYKGEWNNRVVAVKTSSKAQGFTDKEFLDEIKCLRSANHANIVKFLGYCADIQEEVMPFNGTFVMGEHRNRMLCFEYVPNGNIREYLQQDASCGLEWHTRYRIIKGICHGLDHLHGKHIIHLDLKPENILLDNDMTPKITDFGSSRLLGVDKNQTIATRIIGSPGYMSPEYLLSGTITFQCDIYCLGLIILELIMGKKDQHNIENELQKWKFRLGTSQAHTTLEQVKVCLAIGKECVHHNPESRPVIRAIIRRLIETETSNCFPRNAASTSWERAQTCPMSQERTVSNYDMIPARSLDIAWGDNPQFWSWTSRPDSRFGECAQLLRVNYLKISMNIPPKSDQTAATIYTAHLVYKLALRTSGLEDSVQKARTHRYHDYINTIQVSLHPKGSGAGGVKGVTYPITRSDGWLELKLAEFSNKEALTVELFHEDPNPKNEMRGLFIEGMEVRKK